ncbi:MAG: hypothetical protein ACK5NY_07150 [Burkholderiaceae bacterium]
MQDLYAASNDNKTFLHTRFGVGDDPLEHYKDVIIQWINPPDFRNQISVSKAKKAQRLQKGAGPARGPGRTHGVLL